MESIDNVSMANMDQIKRLRNSLTNINIELSG